MLLLLSATAGSTDAIGFLALHGLFTAHFTGNIVILASHVVARGTAGVGQLISVPVFMIVLALARLLGFPRAPHRRGGLAGSPDTAARFSARLLSAGRSPRTDV
jgi:uncharacterized membrane protein YoaK (UPF0700 family)